MKHGSAFKLPKDQLRREKYKPIIIIVKSGARVKCIIRCQGKGGTIWAFPILYHIHIQYRLASSNKKSTMAPMLPNLGHVSPHLAQHVSNISHLFISSFLKGFLHLAPEKSLLLHFLSHWSLILSLLCGSSSSSQPPNIGWFQNSKSLTFSLFSLLPN